MSIFDLPVKYNGCEKDFKCQLLQLGYIYKIQVNVDGLIVLFEPLTEGAVKVDKGLLAAIAEAIEAVVK